MMILAKKLPRMIFIWLLFSSFEVAIEILYQHVSILIKFAVALLIYQLIVHLINYYSVTRTVWKVQYSLCWSSTICFVTVLFRKSPTADYDAISSSFWFFWFLLTLKCLFHF